MNRPLFEIDSGRNVCIAVNGFGSVQDKLEDLYWDSKGQGIKVQITPPCEFQKSQGWPEEPFVNVNYLGNRETTKANWLGYIGGFGNNEKRQLVVDSLLEILKHGDVTAMGKMIREDPVNDTGDYKILLYFSRKSLKTAKEKAEKLPELPQSGLLFEKIKYFFK